jgi:hypothetical protein
MLGKLFKHEMKACARLLLPLYLVLVVLAVMDRIVLGIHLFKGVIAIVPGAFTTIFVFANIAIAVISSVIVIYRFYKNMVTDEGYLKVSERSINIVGNTLYEIYQELMTNNQASAAVIR